MMVSAYCCVIGFVWVLFAADWLFVIWWGNRVVLFFILPVKGLFNIVVLIGLFGLIWV